MLQRLVERRHLAVDEALKLLSEKVVRGR